MSKEDNAKLCCAFCGKNRFEVGRMIAGPKVCICDECIGLCNDIIAEDSGGVLRPVLLYLTGARSAVEALQEVLRRLRGGLPEGIRIESRLVLDEAQAQLDRLWSAVYPEGRPDGGLPSRPPDARDWEVPEFVLPHLWTVLQGLREVLADGSGGIGVEERAIVDDALNDVLDLREQLGSDLRARKGRDRVPELQTRFRTLESELSTVRKRIPESLPPAVVHHLDQALDEVHIVSVRLAPLTPG